MQNRKILIFGRVGQLGWELRHKLACLGEIVSLEFPEVDFTRPDSLRTAIHAHQPAVIVNAAAYTAVDKAENEPELALAINGTAPGILAEEASKINAVLVHYSTDYVFDGSGNSPWLESDFPAPLNVYGQTKLVGDRAIHSSGCDHLIFRTSWVDGARGNNFLLTMLRLAEERDQLSVVDDQIGAPTSAESIAQATACVLSQVLSPTGAGISNLSGIYNCTNAGEASWYAFARAIFAQAEERLGKPQPKLTPIPTTAFPRPAERPRNSRLSGEKLAYTFGVEMPHWETALGLVLETLAEGRL